MSAAVERNADIVRRYHGGESLTDIAATVGVSRQRVEQIVKPDRARARAAAFRAKRSGSLTPPSVCERCSTRGDLQAHHPDYRFALLVEWLCGPCHRAAHVGQPRRSRPRKVREGELPARRDVRSALEQEGFLVSARPRTRFLTAHAPGEWYFLSRWGGCWHVSAGAGERQVAAAKFTSLLELHDFIRHARTARAA